MVYVARLADSSVDSVFIKFASGGLSGIVSRTVCAPFSRLSVLQETRVSINPAEYLVVAEKNNLVHTLRSVYLKDGSSVYCYLLLGIIGFFRGNLVDILRSIPYSSINYGMYEVVSIRLSSTSKNHPTLQHLLAGGAAGMTAVICTYPIDILKTRIYISQKGSTGTVLKTMHKGFNSGGLRSLYKGLVVNLISVIPNMALSFTSYEFIRKWLITNTSFSLVWVSMISGALSGCCANTITFPLHLVQRNLQVTGMGANVKKYSSAWECARYIYQEKGVLGFYAGLLPQYLKTIPKCAISFCIYEMTKKACGV